MAIGGQALPRGTGGQALPQGHRGQALLQGTGGQALLQRYRGGRPFYMNRLRGMGQKIGSRGQGHRVQSGRGGGAFRMLRGVCRSEAWLAGSYYTGVYISCIPYAPLAFEHGVHSTVRVLGRRRPLGRGYTFVLSPSLLATSNIRGAGLRLERSVRDRRCVPRVCGVSADCVC